MRIWTYGELADVVTKSLDIHEESFVEQDELVGYANAAIDEAEAEICKIHEDYLLTSSTLAMVNGEESISLPSNIYANKIRGLVYASGSTIYNVRRVRGEKIFLDRALTNSNSSSTSRYRYLITNASAVADRKLILVPPAKETAASNLTLWYIRNANRIPLTSEYEQVEEVQAAAVNTTTEAMTTTGTYQTGDIIRFTAVGAAPLSLPAGLEASTDYYAIKVDSTHTKFATSYANCLAGVAVDLTSVGAGSWYITRAYNTTTQRAIQIDIPEFASFLAAHMKVRILGKEENSPQFQAAVTDMEMQRKLMVDTLTEMVVDNDNEMTPDLSHYQEHV